MALEIDHEVERLEGRWVITVPMGVGLPGHASNLREYAEESRRPPVGILPIPELSTGWRGVVAYIGVLLAVALFARQGAWGYDWLGLGRIDSVRILAGEWWRNVTRAHVACGFQSPGGEHRLRRVFRPVRGPLPRIGGRLGGNSGRRRTGQCAQRP